MKSIRFNDRLIESNISARDIISFVSHITGQYDHCDIEVNSYEIIPDKENVEMEIISIRFKVIHKKETSVHVFRNNRAINFCVQNMTTYKLI